MWLRMSTSAAASSACSPYIKSTRSEGRLLRDIASNRLLLASLATGDGLCGCPLLLWCLPLLQLPLPSPGPRVVADETSESALSWSMPNCPLRALLFRVPAAEHRDLSMKQSEMYQVLTRVGHMQASAACDLTEASDPAADGAAELKQLAVRSCNVSRTRRFTRFFSVSETATGGAVLKHAALLIKSQRSES